METVEVVIRINKNTFDAINELSKFVDGNHIINGYQMKGHSTVGSMITAVAKGTVLPKGHGRLIEADEVSKGKFHFECECDCAVCSHSRNCECDLINSVPTVIEADKEADL